MATLNYEGKSYELAKKNLSIVKKEDAMYQVKGLEEAYRKQFDFALAVLGSDAMEEIFGSSTLNDEVDVIELTFVVNAIDDAYQEKLVNQSLIKADSIANSKAVNQLIKAGNSIDKITDLDKRIKK